ncbi:MAG: GLUG motif-containing protein [Anaerohalosphaeraceae bacterium]
MRQSVLLLIIGILLNLSIYTHAATYGGGNGTMEDPYQIWTAEQMNTIGANLADWRKCFILMADIDMSVYAGTQYRIIGDQSVPFRGSFDGNGHVIRNLTYSTTANISRAGLFGATEDATIMNLGIEKITISTGGSCIGGLVGYQVRGAISQCYSAGSISSSCVSTYTAESYAGGLVGRQFSGIILNSFSTGSVSCSCFSSSSSFFCHSYAGGLVGGQQLGIITHCYSTSSVAARASSSVYSQNPDSCAGGLIGLCTGSIDNCYSKGSVTSVSQYISRAGGLSGIQSDGVIRSCYSTGSVISASDIRGESSYAWSGGLVGMQYNGRITDCFSTGSVHSTTTNVSASSAYVGGLVGSQNEISGLIEKSYAVGKVTGTGPRVYKGGLLGKESVGTVVSCFWDMETSGLVTSYGGAGKTTMEMMTDSTFRDAGWDFDSIWYMPPHNYPNLIETSCFGVYSGGKGTLEEPYLIATPQDLNQIGLFPADWKKHFRMIVDIDMSGCEGMQHNAIGSSVLPFSGTFDGNGHKIINMTYSISTSSMIEAMGLFAYTSNATIQNLGFENVDISVSQCLFAGVIVGIQSRGKIANCYCSGTMYMSNIYDICVAGGLVGAGDGLINDCYNMCSITVHSPQLPVAGGIIGYSYGTGQSVCRCYNAGCMTGDYMDMVGGVVGFDETTAVASCFWDIQTSNSIVNTGGTGKTTAQMQALSTFTDAGWDFVGETINGTEDEWYIREGIDYPRLTWETKPVANAGLDQTVFAGAQGDAKVELKGEGSSDRDGDTLTYSWLLDGQVIAAECNPAVTLPVGEHVISLIVSDGIVESKPAEVKVTVVAPLQGKLQIVLSTIRRSDTSRYLVAMFELPAGVTALDGKMKLYPGRVSSTLERAVKTTRGITMYCWFEKKPVMNAISANGTVKMTIEGKQQTGRYVFGGINVVVSQ